MAQSDNIFADLYQHLVREFSSWSGWLQLALILGCGLVAWLVHLRWRRLVHSRLGKVEKKGFARATIRSTERAVFPLTTFFLVYLGAQLLESLGFTIWLIDTIAIPLLLSFAGVRVCVFILRRAFSPSPMLKAWEGAISITIWTVFALYLLDWHQEIIKWLEAFSIPLGKSKFSLWSLIKLLLTIVVFIVVAGWIARLIEQGVVKSPHLNASMRVGLVKFSKFILYTLAILLAIGSTGVDLTSLHVFGGALGVGLGFGLQRIASNFISGFILLFDRSIRPGDVITVGNRFGWVQELHARYIVVRDRDGVETLIPNENLITSEVTNWSYSDRKVRLKLPVQISYADDPERAIELMVQACAGIERVLENPGPQGRLLRFGDNGMELELRLWIRDPERGIGGIKSQVNLGIWRLFKAHGITIPFPQRDVHLLHEGGDVKQP